MDRWSFNFSDTIGLAWLWKQYFEKLRSWKVQNEVGKMNEDHLQWDFPTLSLIFQRKNFQLHLNCQLALYFNTGNSSEIIFPKICCWKSEKIQINPEIFFHLIVSLFFSKWGLFLGVWISVCLFVFVPLKNREINNSMPKYKLQLLHPISSDFINPAIPKSDNSAFLDE